MAAHQGKGDCTKPVVALSQPMHHSQCITADASGKDQPWLLPYTQQAWHTHRKNEDWTMPMVALSQPNCSAMGRIAMLMLTRSILHSMKAMKHSPMMVHRRFHRPPNTCCTTLFSMYGSLFRMFAFSQGLLQKDRRHCLKASLQRHARLSCARLLASPPVAPLCSVYCMFCKTPILVCFLLRKDTKTHLKVSN